MAISEIYLIILLAPNVVMKSKERMKRRELKKRMNGKRNIVMKNLKIRKKTREVHKGFKIPRGVTHVPVVK